MYKSMDNPSASRRGASGQGAVESARRGESNGVGSEACTWLLVSAGREREIPQPVDVSQSQEGSHWNPLA